MVCVYMCVHIYFFLVYECVSVCEGSQGVTSTALLCDGNTSDVFMPLSLKASLTDIISLGKRSDPSLETCMTMSNF